jgi:hypothetical protein
LNGTAIDILRRYRLVVPVTQSSVFIFVILGRPESGSGSCVASASIMNGIGTPEVGLSMLRSYPFRSTHVSSTVSFDTFVACATAARSASVDNVTRSNTGGATTRIDSQCVSQISSDSPTKNSNTHSTTRRFRTLPTASKTYRTIYTNFQTIRSFPVERISPLNICL